MRVLLVGAAFLLFAAPASAQTNAPADSGSSNPASACGALTSPPRLPDGATADNDAMNAGNTAFLAWAQPQQQVLACRRAEADAAHARWLALSSEYNTGAQALNNANNAWDTEVQQYNDRAGGGRRNGASH